MNIASFSKRLQKIMHHYGDTASSFADKIGVQRSSISHIVSGRNKPSLDFILKLLSAFPDVEWNWLLNGSGNFPAKEPIEIKNDTPSSSALDNVKMHDPSTDRMIDRIVIFYSDGTFKHFQN